MTNEEIVGTDEMVEFLDQFDDMSLDESISGLHILSGMVDSRLYRRHQELGQHPTECCKYCVSKEIHRAAVRWVRDKNEDDWHSLVKAVEEYEQ